MRVDDIEPLEFGAWFCRISHVSSWPIHETDTLERALRHSFHLVQLAPLALRPVINCAVSEDEFEALLDEGDQLGAATALICDASWPKAGLTRNGAPAAGGFAGEPMRCGRATTPLDIFARWLTSAMTICEIEISKIEARVVSPSTAGETSGTT